MIKFLLRFLGISSGLPKPDRAIDDVAVTENISRFIFQNNHFKSGEAKTAAFLPRNAEISVCRIDNLSETDIWDIAINRVGAKRNPPKNPLARADLTVESIIKNEGLKVVSDPTPFPQHANIVGWPLSKDEQKMLALELAKSASLRLKPA